MVRSLPGDVEFIAMRSREDVRCWSDVSDAEDEFNSCSSVTYLSVDPVGRGSNSSKTKCHDQFPGLECKPCFRFHSTKGCPYGATCMLCHSCDGDAFKCYRRMLKKKNKSNPTYTAAPPVSRSNGHGPQTTAALSRREMKAAQSRRQMMVATKSPQRSPMLALPGFVVPTKSPQRSPMGSPMMAPSGFMVPTQSPMHRFMMVTQSPTHSPMAMVQSPMGSPMMMVPPEFMVPMQNPQMAPQFHRYASQPTFFPFGRM